MTTARTLMPDITGLGAVTSVGRSVVGACAALRAGISRPREMTWYTLLDEHAYVEAPVVGHPVAGFTEGFALTGVWVRLALGALSDLAAYARLPGAEDTRFWEATGLLVTAPEMASARFGEGGDDLEDLRDTYLERIVSLWGRPLNASVRAVISGGNAAALRALQAATESLATEAVERVVVLGADSYLDELSVAWLAEQQRLRSPAQPTGLAPGEAAACVLLEAPSSTSGRGARAEATLVGVATGEDTRSLALRDASGGGALGRAMRACLTTPPRSPGRFPGSLVADLNGEGWRAKELGLALLSVSDLGSTTKHTYPAVSFGDTGAASGPLGICAAVRALVRGYGNDEVLVAASSAEGVVGAARFDGASRPREVTRAIHG